MSRGRSCYSQPDFLLDYDGIVTSPRLESHNLTSAMMCSMLVCVIMMASGWRLKYDCCGVVFGQTGIDVSIAQLLSLLIYVLMLFALVRVTSSSRALVSIPTLRDLFEEEARVFCGVWVTSVALCLYLRPYGRLSHTGRLVIKM